MRQPLPERRPRRRPFFPHRRELRPRLLSFNPTLLQLPSAPESWAQMNTSRRPLFKRLSNSPLAIRLAMVLVEIPSVTAACSTVCQMYAMIALLCLARAGRILAPHVHCRSVRPRHSTHFYRTRASWQTRNARRLLFVWNGRAKLTIGAIEQNLRFPGADIAFLHDDRELDVSVRFFKKIQIGR